MQTMQFMFALTGYGYDFMHDLVDDGRRVHWSPPRVRTHTDDSY